MYIAFNRIILLIVLLQVMVITNGLLPFGLLFLAGFASRPEVLEHEDNRPPPKPVPVHDEAKKIYFQLLDLLWYGIDALRKMEPEEQELRILEGVVTNSNYGFPNPVTQTKKNFKKLVTTTASRIFPHVYKKHLINGELFITVNFVFDLISAAGNDEYHGPFIHWWRTQIGRYITKHRSVFGGDWLMKLLGAVVQASKKIGYKREAAIALGQISEDYESMDSVKYIPERGGLPVVAQHEWTIMFEGFLNKMPEFDSDWNLKSYTHEEIMARFPGVDIPQGEYVYDVFGDDFPGFDQSIIRGDIEWLTTHPKWGWINRWILDCLEESEVWFGPKRIFDIFFKSGHPFTSDWGSAHHLNILFQVRDFVRAKGRYAEILGLSVLSDDDIVYAIGITVEDIVEYLEQYGLTIKIHDSFVYSRDKIVSFLKVLIGHVFDGVAPTYVGDMITRYTALAHSERDIEKEISKGDDSSITNEPGVYNITGDVELDSFLSKLASFSSNGRILVRAILEFVKDTDLGRRAIVAISQMDKFDAESYRTDVLTGFPPAWLGSLDVLDLLEPVTA
jgi:hypothetical protein